MANKTPAQKLLIKPGMSLVVANPPADFSQLLGGLPQDVQTFSVPEQPLSSAQPADMVLAFIQNRQELEAQLSELQAALKPQGISWIAYHKGTSKTKTDINRDSINSYAQTIGLQGVAMISIDEDWSALRLKPR